MIISLIMVFSSRLSLFVKRLTRRIKRLFCSATQAKGHVEREELMEAGLLPHEATINIGSLKTIHKNGYIGKETRVPSIQMSPIEAPRRTVQKSVNRPNLAESTQADASFETNALKDTIRYLLASKHGIDRQKLAIIIRMQKEHKENELEGPVLIDPVCLLGQQCANS